jgi:hypothetical protein
MNNVPYRPQANGLPAQVISFFQQNPDEELSVDDIINKFPPVARASVHTQLRTAVEHDILKRKRNDDGEYIYSAGKDIKAIDLGANLAQIQLGGRADRQPINRARFYGTIDFDKLKVEEGIPLQTGPYIKGMNKWQPLFDKLKKPGQSLTILANVRGAVGAAAYSLNKKKTHGQYRVALVSADSARVWRIA